jgi:hypothetical protein
MTAEAALGAPPRPDADGSHATGHDGEKGWGGVTADDTQPRSHAQMVVADTAFCRKGCGLMFSLQTNSENKVCSTGA